MGAISAQPLWLKIAVFRVGQNVRNLNGLALKQHPACYGTPPQRKRESLMKINVFWREAVTCRDIVACISRAENLRHVRLAKPGRSFDQGIQHGSEIKWRAADDFKHIGGSGLLLERLAEVARACLHLAE